MSAPYPPPENPLNIPRTPTHQSSPATRVEPFGRYNGCVKCGLVEPDIDRPEDRVFWRRLCSGKVMTPDFTSGDIVVEACGDGEGHLHLTCPSCGHEWLTRCADAGAPPAGIPPAPP
jgi:hypothetical protein